MFIRSQNNNTKKVPLKNQLKGMREIQAISKFKESMLRKRRKIEQLFFDSVPNQIYIFPKSNHIHPLSDSSSDDGSLHSECQNLIYDLRSQNRCDKNYQTSSMILFRCNSLTSTEAEHEDVRPKVKQPNNSYCLCKQVNTSKNQVNSSINKSKKVKQQQPTAINSDKRLSFLPPNASTKDHSKKGSKTIIVSFRGKQKERSRNTIIKTDNN